MIAIMYSDKLSKEVKRIKLLMSWNNFPKHISNKLTKLWQENKKIEKHEDNETKIWIRVPYVGEYTDRIVGQSIKKLKKCMKKSAHVKYCLTYDTNKIEMFTNTKDKTPL